MNDRTRPPSQPVTCSSCGQPIQWSETAATGSAVPMDQPPAKRYVLSKNGLKVHLVDTWAPHHASCPHAKAHSESAAKHASEQEDLAL